MISGKAMMLTCIRVKTTANRMGLRAATRDVGSSIYCRHARPGKWTVTERDGSVRQGTPSEVRKLNAAAAHYGLRANLPI